MNPFEDNEDPMKEIRELMEEHQKEREKREKCHEEVEAELRKDEERVEKEVLMNLWSKVGNAPHTYFVAMKTIHQFIKTLKELRAITGLPEDMHLLVMESLAECATLDAKCIRLIMEKKAKFQIE